MVQDSNTISRFNIYAGNCQKYTYAGGVCTLLSNAAIEPDTMFSPVYTTVNKRPALQDVNYIPYITFDLDIRLSDYNIRLLEMPPHQRTNTYAELVLDAMQSLDVEPTLVVGTGGGAHVYYELQRESANAIQAISNVYSAASSKLELLTLGLDVASCNAVSSVRLPDRATSKYDGYTVSILHADDNTYEVAEINGALAQMTDVSRPTDVTLGRNTYLYRLGIYLLYEGYDIVEVEERLNEEFELVRYAGTHPFTRSELNGILKSLTRAKVRPSHDSDVIKAKLRELASRVGSLLSKEAQQDVYHAIITRYALVTGNCFPISQKELATYTGVPQQTISRMLRTFIKRGLLEIVNSDYKVGKYCKTYRIPKLRRV